MFVKVCGITNLEDALAAVQAGANALGFIFHPASPRYIAPSALAKWIAQIPAHIWRVGVWVDQPAEEIEQISRSLGLHVAQLHGSEMPEAFPQGLRIWKAIRVRDHFDPSWNDYPCEALLLDGPSSGARFDWSIARQARTPVILAGGLDEENIGQAIAAVKPWGVDVCSSLEGTPGHKDHARMARFLEVCQPALLKPH